MSRCCRCDNAQTILTSIDQQITTAKTESMQTRQKNAEYLEERNKAYNAKLAGLEEKGGSSNAGSKSIPGQMGLGYNPPAPFMRSTGFDTPMTDQGDDALAYKGRKSVSIASAKL